MGRTKGAHVRQIELKKNVLRLCRAPFNVTLPSVRRFREGDTPNFSLGHEGVAENFAPVVVNAKRRHLIFLSDGTGSKAENHRTGLFTPVLHRKRKESGGIVTEAPKFAPFFRGRAMAGKKSVKSIAELITGEHDPLRSFISLRDSGPAS